MYYFNARWYDPTLGRFITEDPIKDGNNWHVYVNNNPLTFIDPTGLATIPNGAVESGDIAVDKSGNYVSSKGDKGHEATDIYGHKKSSGRTTGGSDSSSEIQTSEEEIFYEINYEKGSEPTEEANISSGKDDLPWYAKLPIVPHNLGSSYFNIKSPMHFTKYGIDPEVAQELSDIENNGNIRGTAIGSGFVASYVTGTMAGFFTTIVSAGASTKITGGSTDDIITNISVASLAGWIPTGSEMNSVLGEGVKSALASAFSQKATSGEIEANMVISYGVLGMCSQFTYLSGFVTPDIGLKVLGGQVIPTVGSLVIENEFKD